MIGKAPTATLKRGSAFRRRFARTDGAIDLASIMVGVIVIGIVGSVISATVFAVIPWSQDQAARANLDVAAAAQSTARVAAGEYFAYDSLTAGPVAAGKIGLAPSSAGRLVMETTETGWFAASRSDSGAVFYRSSAAPEARGIALGEEVEAAAVPAGYAQARARVVIAAVRGSDPVPVDGGSGSGVNASAELTAYLAAQGEEYKRASGAFYQVAGLPEYRPEGWAAPEGVPLPRWSYDSAAATTDPAFGYGPNSAVRIVDLVPGKNAGLSTSGEGLIAFAVGPDGGVLISILSIEWPENTDWGNPDYSTATYQVSTPVDAHDYAAAGAVLWGTSAAEYQYQVNTTLEFMGLPSRDPGPCPAGWEAICS